MFKLKYDVMYRPRVISLGIDFGNNYIIKGKISNIFLDVSILDIWFRISMVII